jgi:hypothetical protein
MSMQKVLANLTMADLPRKKDYAIDLNNQGLTCYLNSLL